MTARILTVKRRGLALLMCIINILSMGCTRNLQLGEQSGVKGPGTFFVWAQCRPFTHLLSASKKTFNESHKYDFF